jgi:hypothetical protein
LIKRSAFIKKAGLSSKIILALFVIKVAAGIILGWISFTFSKGNDYWFLNNEGISEFQQLKSNPIHFFNDVLFSPYSNKYGGFFNAVGSYWNDLRNNIIIKFIAILDLLSNGNYYINSLFFSCIGFIGHISLYRIFSDCFPDKKKLLIFSCFLIPTTLYFSSGIHKDQIVFTALGLYCYALYFGSTQQFNWKKILLLLLSCGVILLMRNFLFVGLMPASIAFYASRKWRINPVMIFPIVYLIFIGLFFTINKITTTFNPMEIVVQRQADFMNLRIANSQIPLDKLEPHASSYLKNLPQAINHGFLRPYPFETTSIFSILLATELVAFISLFIFYLFNAENKKIKNNEFVYFGICLSIFMFIFIGYTIPNYHSIIRYKSIFLPFIITPLICSVKLKWKNSYYF